VATLTRPAIVWLLVLALPLRALTAMYLDLRGPLHFHHHHDDDEYHEHDHGHSHAHAERHHHPAGDPTVIAVGDELPMADGTAVSGWSATMCVAAAAPRAWPDLPQLRHAAVAGIEARLQTRHPGRLERPPRTVLA